MPYDQYAQLFARHYDASYAVSRDPSGDARFYRQLAHETGGPVLELGCGTGRVLLPIANDGIECVGLDPSPEMLAVFQQKALPSNLRLVQGRMQDFDLGDARFRLITCPFRAFGHLLDVGEQLAALAQIRKHLAPGGTFALDVFDPKLSAMARLEEPESLAITFEENGQRMERWDTVRRDLSRQVLEVECRFKGGPLGLEGSTMLQLRWYYRFELEHLLARAGFTDLTFFGTFQREPWAAGKETIVLARAS